MDLLPDAHAFIWFMEGDDSLPAKSIKAIKDVSNNCYLSAVS
jgi:PIN domain nuclease of toxin-antitoxin system